MKTLLRFSTLAILLIIFISSVGWGQSANDYKSKSSGNWDESSTWQIFTKGGIWIDASTPPSVSTTANIFIYHSVTVRTNVDARNITLYSSSVLTINSGSQLNIQTLYTLTINSSSGCVVNGSLVLYGNLVNSGNCTINGVLNRNIGTITGTIIYGANSTLEYSGNSDKNTGDEFPVSNGPKSLKINCEYYYWTIFLTGNRTIEGDFYLLKGGLNTLSNTLTFGPSGTITHNATDCIIEGYFERWVATTQSDILFPMGFQDAANGYQIKSRPVTISTFFSGTGASGGTIKVKYINADPTSGTSPETATDNGATVNTYWDKGYWEITSGNGLNVGSDLSASYTVILNADGITTGVTNWDKLRVMKKSNLTDAWGYLDGTTRKLDGTYEQGGTSSNKFAKRSGLKTFSYFGIGGASSEGNELDGANPVTMESFSHSTVSNNILLTWVTSMEENNSGFDIERKKVDGEWSKIGYIKGNGTTNNQITYKYSDKNLATGKYQYRLKQIDYNGNFEYHALQGFVEVGVPNKFEMSQNYPNPFNPVTKIDFEIPENRHVNIKVYDMLGKEVKTLVNEIKQAGYHTLELNASNMASGTYIYRMVAGDFTKTLKMVVVK